MRTLRKAIEIGLPVVGTLIVFGAVLFIVQLQVQLLLVLIGMLMVQAGVWGLSQPFLPNERSHLPLRREVDRFIGLVRELNASAIRFENQGTDETRQTMERLRAAMHESVDRMTPLAGKTSAPGDGGPPPT